MKDLILENQDTVGEFAKLIRLMIDEETKLIEEKFNKRIEELENKLPNTQRIIDKMKMLTSETGRVGNEIGESLQSIDKNTKVLKVDLEKYIDIITKSTGKTAKEIGEELEKLGLRVENGKRPLGDIIEELAVAWKSLDNN